MFYRRKSLFSIRRARDLFAQDSNFEEGVISHGREFIYCAAKKMGLIPK